VHHDPGHLPQSQEAHATSIAAGSSRSASLRLPAQTLAPLRPGAESDHRSGHRANALCIGDQIENVPTKENPRTGRITALSIIAALSRLTATLVAGG
jgi:hypothetical protein